MKFPHRTLSLILTAVLILGSLSLTASADSNTMYGIGFVTASSLRLRSSNTTSSSTLDMAPRNDCVVVISKNGDWYKVNYNLQIGYMHKDYLSVLTKENAELGYGKINGTRVNMRSGPSTSYGIIAVTEQGGKCYIIGLNEGWYKVIYNGKTGYIRSDYVDLTEIPYENQESSNSPKYFRHGKAIGSAPSVSGSGSASSQNSNSAWVNDSSQNSSSSWNDDAPQNNGSLWEGGNDSGWSEGSSNQSNTSSSSVSSISGSAILAEAQKYLGIPYVYGGASPSGFDCSGFVYYVLKQVGFSAYRTPADQYSHGTYVDKADLQPGDIVFFAGTYASGISHVGIYAGGGQFIHSPNSRSTVSYSDLTSGYWSEHYYGARRIG